MHKIGIIGDEESIRMFATVGISVFPVQEAKEAVKVVKELSDSGYAVLFVTEDLYSSVEPVTENTPIPIVIPVPGINEKTGAGVERLRAMALQAIGSDLAFKGDTDNE